MPHIENYPHFRRNYPSMIGIAGPPPRGGGGAPPRGPGPGPRGPAPRGPMPRMPAMGPRHFHGGRHHHHGHHHGRGGPWWGGNWYAPVVYAYPYCDPYWDPYCPWPPHYAEISGNANAAQVEQQRAMNMLRYEHPSMSPVHPYTAHRPSMTAEDWPLERGVAVEGMPGGCGCVGSAPSAGCIEAGVQVGEGYMREMPGWRVPPNMGVWVDVGYQRPRTVGWNGMLASNELISRGPTDSLDINSLAFGT